MRPNIQLAIGALSGSAVGDALGAPFEFGPAGQFTKRFPTPALGPSTEMIGGGRFGWEPGEFTDDTQMAVVIAESLLTCGRLDGADMFERFRQWAEVTHDIGKQTRNVLAVDDWEHSAADHYERTGHAAGNGSLMRATTSALFAGCGSVDNSIELALAQSKLTHGDPAAGWGAALYHGMIHTAVHGGSPLDALPDLLGRLPEPHQARYRELLMSDTPLPDEESNGTVWTCLAQAVRVLRQASSFEDAMRRVCDVAGDVDTVACVTGGLAGAWFGVQAIPSRWLTHVHGRVGTARYANRDLQQLALRLIGQKPSRFAADLPPRGPVEIRPGVFAANTLGALTASTDHAILSLCRVEDRFTDWPYRREFFLIDQPDANPRLGDVLADAIAEIDAFRAAGIPVVVHCHAGESRTGFILRAWLMHHEHLGADQATDQLADIWPYTRHHNTDFDNLLHHLSLVMDDDPGNSAPPDPDAWMRSRFADDKATAGQPGSNNFARHQFARFAAPALAQAALAGRRIKDFVPAGPVSLRTVMFADDDDETLVVVVGAHEPVNEVEKALPYALEYVGDRDLILVIPHGTEWPHLARLPWLDQHTRVFTHQANDPASIREHPIPLRSEVLDKARAPATKGTHVLSPTQLGWADELIAWADAHPRLLAGHRPGYLAWLVDGRLVLRIQRASGGKLRVSAGVQPGTTSLTSGGLETILDSPLLDPEPLRAVIRSSIAERLAGRDTGNLEHRFQARLQQLEPAERMGLLTFIAEYPAMRPRPQGQAPGSIDFLGVDATGRLHVLEAKVGGSDSMVFLQALDYWIWVEANRTELAEHLHADPERPTALSVVILPARDGSVLQRHNRTVADRLNRSVPLRVLVAGADLDAKLSLRPLPFGQARAGSRFTDRLRLRTQAAAAMTHVPQVAEPDGSNPVAGVFGGSREAAAKLSAQGGLHRYVHLPHSSQRFALDLFGSLGAGGAARLLTRYFGAIAHADDPTFEWTDNDDLLRESTSSRPWRTQVDVFLEGNTRDGRTVGLLVEVKLTEAAFGGCSHAEVAPPPNREVCSQSGPFGGDPDQCWQLRNRDAGPRRRYDEVLPIAESGPDVGAGCWFRERNQPMRLAALAAALVDAGRYDECVTVLTAPSGHVSMRRRWSESAGMFEPGLLGWLEPEVALSVLSLESQAFLIDRYGLGAPDATLHDPSSIEVRGWELMAELLCQHPQLELIETHPAGGLYDCLTLFDPAEKQANGPQIYLNREGSLHVLHPDPVESMRDVWHRLAAGEVDAIVAWCERALAISQPPSAVRGWPRAFPRIARAHQGRARWRNGMYDSSGYGSGVMTQWFEQLPFLKSVNHQRGNDLFGNSAYRFWFLVNEADEALAAIELPQAKGWTRDGTIYYLDASDGDDAFVTVLT